jgi:hypothetical protein
LLKRGSVLVAVALALLAFAAAADARVYIAIDNVRSQPETLDGHPGSLSFDFTESGLPPGSKSTYCFYARATVTTLGREFRPGSHGGRWFATMRRVSGSSGSLVDYFRGDPGACAYTAAADATGSAHGRFTGDWPHLRMLPFLAQWTVGGIEMRDVTHGVDGFGGCPTTPSSYAGNECDGGLYRTYCNGFRTQFVETGAVPDLADCSAGRVRQGWVGPGYEHPQTAPEVLAADDAAMSNALKLRDQMRDCYWGTPDYSACAAQITAESSGLPLGGARGQAEITEAKPPGDPGLPAPDPVYTIVAHSLSGTDFTLYEPWTSVSPLLVYTSCSKPHRGFCGPEGLWSDRAGKL